MYPLTIRQNIKSRWLLNIEISSIYHKILSMSFRKASSGIFTVFSSIFVDCITFWCATFDADIAILLEIPTSFQLHFFK